MFSHEEVELRESTVRNRYLTPPGKAGGGAGSKSSAEQVRKKRHPHARCARGVHPCLQLQGFIN